MGAAADAVLDTFHGGWTTGAAGRARYTEEIRASVRGEDVAVPTRA